MHIRQLRPEDATSFQHLRLTALREEPSAFSSSHEEEKDRPMSAIESQLAPALDEGIFGAFANDALVGVVAVGHERMNKLAHRGFIWGMYVRPTSRQHGVGRSLLNEALSFARRVPGLRQVNLGVNSNNAAAMQLYLSVGFKAFGHEIDAMLVDGALHNETHMSLKLSAD